MGVTLLVTVDLYVMTAAAEEVVIEVEAVVPMSANKCKTQVKYKSILDIMHFTIKVGKYRSKWLHLDNVRIWYLSCCNIVKLIFLVIGFGHDNKDGGGWNAIKDNAYNSFGGRSDRNKSAFYNDRGSSRGR